MEDECWQDDELQIFLTILSMNATILFFAGYQVVRMIDPCKDIFIGD
jgi:hypothetical protein